jgi:hypothetical protein
MSLAVLQNDAPTSVWSYAVPPEHYLGVMTLCMHIKYFEQEHGSINLVFVVHSPLLKSTQDSVINTFSSLEESAYKPHVWHRS